MQISYFTLLALLSHLSLLNCYNVNRALIRCGYMALWASEHKVDGKDGGSGVELEWIPLRIVRLLQRKRC